MAGASATLAKLTAGPARGAWGSQVSNWLPGCEPATRARHRVQASQLVQTPQLSIPAPGEDWARMGQSAGMAVAMVGPGFASAACADTALAASCWVTMLTAIASPTQLRKGSKMMARMRMKMRMLQIVYGCVE